VSDNRHTHDVEPWTHDHRFGQEHRRPGERRTFVVIALTVATMAVEIAAGIAFGSMVLLADGLHMASHAVALGVSAFAYVYARRHADDPRYSFGTGKINTLSGFGGAVLLGVFSLTMVVESIDRLLHPVAIVFDYALMVAVLGLVVNGVSALVLGGGGASHDHNLRSAYLHVIADALTSVVAIVALLAGKYFGLVWMDPAMGILGALLVARWSVGLMRSSGRVLLDRQGPPRLRERVRNAVEADGDSTIVDFHVWSIGPGIYSLVMTVVADRPVNADVYRERLPDDLGLAHVSIEVQQCPRAGRERNTRQG